MSLKRKHAVTSFEFKISLAKEKHKNKYDYSLAENKGFKEPIKIICPVHGIFTQRIYSHSMDGQGCTKCAREYNILALTETQESWIKRINDKHPKILTDRVVYIKSRIKVEVGCLKHGYYWCMPKQVFLSGGCWHCGRDRAADFSRENPAFWSKTQWDDKGKNSKNFNSFKVYVIKCWNEYEEFYKIGRTFTTVFHRFRDKSLMPYKFEIIKEFIFENAKNAYDKENELKKYNKDFKYVPLLSFGGKHECFVKIEKLNEETI